MDTKKFLSMPPEKRRAWAHKRIEEAFEKLKPAPDGTCKSETCGGRVVQRCNGIFHRQYTYGTPRCEKCGRIYPMADRRRIPSIGEEEIDKLLSIRCF